MRSNNAIQISPNGGKIAYARFDDTEVPEFQYPVYGDPFNVSKNKYPEYKYIWVFYSLYWVKYKNRNMGKFDTFTIIGKYP